MDTPVQRGFRRPEVGAHPITCPARPSGTATTPRAFLSDSLAGPTQQRRPRTTGGVRSPFRSFSHGGPQRCQAIWSCLFPFPTGSRRVDAGVRATITFKGPSSVCAVVVKGEELPRLNPPLGHEAQQRFRRVSPHPLFFHQQVPLTMMIEESGFRAYHPGIDKDLIRHLQKI
eukprot:3932257-Rhodomonas_salina.1